MGSTTFAYGYSLMSWKELEREHKKLIADSEVLANRFQFCDMDMVEGIILRQIAVDKDIETISLYMDYKRPNNLDSNEFDDGCILNRVAKFLGISINREEIDSEYKYTSYKRHKRHIG